MPSVLLQCPHCGLQKKVAETVLPQRPSMVRCPKCEKAFRFEGVQTVPSAVVQPAEATALARPGGFWVRLLALMLDGLLVVVLAQLMAFALTAATAGFGGPMTAQREAVLQAGILLAGVTVGLCYFTGWTALTGGTPGKHLFGLKVIRTVGEDVGWSACLIREFPGKLLSLLLFGYGFLIAAFRSDKAALHDSIADTRVIYR